MSYTFVKIADYYPEAIKSYYKKHSNIRNKSYNEQLNHLMGQAIGWADFFTKNMKKFGINAYEIVANAIPLQKAWAKEHGIKAIGHELIVEQLKTLQPDVVFFQNSFNCSGDWINYIRSELSKVKKIIGWCCIGYSPKDFERLRPFDYLLTCTPGFKHKLNQEGKLTYQLNHAFEESLLAKLINNHYSETNLIFIGSLFQTKGFHNFRLNVIEDLIKQNIQIRIHSKLEESLYWKTFIKQLLWYMVNDSTNIIPKKYLMKFPLVNRILQWQEKPVLRRYPHQIKLSTYPPLFGLEMLRAIAKAKIGFNIHLDSAGQYAGNMRLFEVTGVGTCLLTDHKKNISRLFVPDKEILTYSSVEECIEKAKWLLEHPKERKIIAQAGQARVLKEHTFYHRAKELDSIIRKNL